MNLIDFILIAAILTALFFAVKSMIIHKKSGGCSGCGGACPGTCSKAARH